MKIGKWGLFLGGVLFGTAGIKILASKDAKKAYTHATAAVLRAKDCVMEVATNVKENCGDIYDDAKQINEDRAVKEEESVISDAANANDAE
ncbi:MAG: hypothetical protein IKO41_10890 [Lachnospiraceae bacterium]|nr:hypothetical protein [Lachnospiraceae bacterium]MBQ9490475.1 hypothetical protein [Lachnospiraceae bacterium]MBR4606713.1 hypothetical protein [Lachnospiraceae bacterium]